MDKRDFIITVVLLFALVVVSIAWGFDICNRRWQNIVAEKDEIINIYRIAMEEDIGNIEEMIEALDGYVFEVESYLGFPTVEPEGE